MPNQKLRKFKREREKEQHLCVLGVFVRAILSALTSFQRRQRVLLISLPPMKRLFVSIVTILNHVIMSPNNNKLNSQSEFFPKSNYDGTEISSKICVYLKRKRRKWTIFFQKERIGSIIKIIR